MQALINTWPLLLVPLFGGCVTEHVGTAQIDNIILSSDTNAIEGYLKSDRGEIAIFIQKNRNGYDPFGAENTRCVTLVPTSGNLERGSIASLDGQRIVARGRAIAYDDIPLGGTDIDKLTYRRYYSGYLVLNECVRKYVFLYNVIMKAH